MSTAFSFSSTEVAPTLASSPPLSRVSYDPFGNRHEIPRVCGRHLCCCVLSCLNPSAAAAAVVCESNKYKYTREERESEERSTFGEHISSKKITDK